jgi:hypothetical protein
MELFLLGASTEDGLPVAVQVVGRPWHDHVAMAARCIEHARPAGLPVTLVHP